MRRIMAAIALTLATGGAAQTGGPIAVRGPFYAVGNPGIGGPDEMVIFAAGGTRVRSGNAAGLTELAFRVRPRQLGPVTIGRFDAAIQFDCARRGWRATIVVVRDMNNRLVRTLPDANDSFRPIDAADRAKAAELTLACDGVAPAGPQLLTDTDMERAIGRYRASRGG